MYAFDNAGISAIAMVLAGWKGERPSLLTLRRATPSVSFGGTYKITDFALPRELMCIFPPPCQMTEGTNRIQA